MRLFTFEQVDVGVGGVPAQRIEHHCHGTILLHRVRVRRPLIVQHHGGVHPGAEAAPRLLVSGQDLVQAQHGALGPSAHYGVAAGVDGAADVPRAERQEGAAVQQQALGAVVLQQSFQHRALHFAQLLHRTSFRAACVGLCVASLSCECLFSQLHRPSDLRKAHGSLRWIPSAPLFYLSIVTALFFTHSPVTSPSFSLLL